MVEKFNEKANALAHEYWRLQEITAEGAGGNRLEEIEKLLEKGIGGKLKDQLEVEAKRLRKEVDDISGAFMKLGEIEKEILEMTAELAPNLDLFEDDFFPYDSEHEPISEEFFSALTNLFFGAPSPSIQFKVATFSKDGIKVDLAYGRSSLEVLGYVIMMIQETAKQMLGMENTIDKCCELLKQNEYAFIVLGTLLKEGRRLGMKEIREISHREDKEYKELVRDIYDKELVNGIAYLVGDGWEYNLIKEYDDKYEATDFGEMVWRICNAKTSEDEGKMKRVGISNSSLNIHNILKFLKK
ncbi:MAG: hypothetical protein JJE19_01690 [Methanosarcinales archaeon]|nr:hypothetical protein [Methanosarcinales archaeon]